MEVEYQDGDVMIVSRNPLEGRLTLVTDNDDDIDLLLDKDSAEELMSALAAFLMEGEGGDGPA
jgi:hypothetical protein